MQFCDKILNSSAIDFFIIHNARFIQYLFSDIGYCFYWILDAIEYNQINNRMSLVHINHSYQLKIAIGLHTTIYWKQ